MDKVNPEILDEMITSSPFTDNQKYWLREFTKMALGIDLPKKCVCSKKRFTSNDGYFSIW